MLVQEPTKEPLMFPPFLSPFSSLSISLSLFLTLPSSLPFPHSPSLRPSVPPSLFSFRHLSTSLADRDLLCTCYSEVVEGKVVRAAGLWKVGEEGGDPSPLEHLCQLKQEGNMRW